MQQPAAVEAESQLRLTLSDIALLTRVQRAVVSTWRSRSRGTDTPFPDPVAVERRQELFDAAEVLEWLAATGLGKNPNAAEDVAAFAVFDGFGQHPERHITGITALLTLRSLMGRPLHTLNADDLLDEADAFDPDNEFLYSELEDLGDNLLRVAAYTDLLTDAAYSPEAAFEKLMADRFRTGQREQIAAALTEDAVDLVAAVAVDLATGMESKSSVFVDATAGGSDLLMQIVRRSGEYTNVTIMTPADGGGVSRLVRRRLRIHGVQRENLHVDEAGRLDLSGPAVHVAQFPPPGDPAMSVVDILAVIEDIMLQMDDEQRGVFIGPASVLVDTALSREVDELRSGLLRLGTVRAAVRLPRGLLKAKPRQPQALWVLGPSQRNVDIANRWIMVADLSGLELTADVRQDLISDLAASMESRVAARAHSFRFARPVLTRSLLTSRGLSVQVAGPSSTSVVGSGIAAEVDQLVAALNDEPAPERLALDVEIADPAQQRKPSTIGEMLAAGYLRYLPGNRLAPSDLHSDSGWPVLGISELVGKTAVGARRIHPLVLAGAYPAARLTEPRDVVFCTGSQAAACVDADGGTVVLFPARVLRISHADPDGLLAEVLAADINAAPANGDRWQHWPVRRVSETTYRGLRTALKEIKETRAQARRRLEALTKLESLVLDGAANGDLKIVSMKGTN